MKNYLLKSLSLLFFLTYANIATANSCSCDEEPACAPCCTEVPQTVEPYRCAYNAPARIDTACGWDTWVSGGVIYWQSKEKGLEPAFEYTKQEASNTNDRKALFINNNYHPGFKIGLGASSETDNWTIYFEYTKLKSSDSYTLELLAAGPNNYIDKSCWISNAAPEGLSSYIKGKWFLNFDVCDLELGRPFYLGKRLICSPHFGMRVAKIDQQYNLDSYSHVSDEVGFVDITSRNYQDSWLVGPRSGIKTDWMLGGNFRLIGNLAGSLSYQNFKANTKETIPSQENFPTAEIYTATMENSYLTP